MKKLNLIIMLVSLYLVTGCASDVHLITEGENALFSGNYDRAITDLTACVRAEGDKGDNSSYCSFLLGKAYFDKKRYPEAIKYFKRAIDIAPRADSNTYGLLPAWYFWLGRAYSANGQHKEAIAYLKKAVAIAPEQIPDNWWPKWKGRTLQPTKASCYFWLGYAYYNDKQFQEAVNAFKRTINLSSSAPDPYTVLAASYIQLKKYDKAITATKRAIQIKPNSFAYITMGNAYCAKKQFNEAIAAYKKAVEIDPNYSAAFRKLGLTLSEKKDYNGAAQAFKKAAELSPSILSYWTDLAITYYRMGQYYKALDASGKALISGIGAHIRIDSFPRVVKVMPGGPAEAVGMVVGDRITKIDKTSTKGWTLARVIKHLRGPVGTSVILTIHRNGAVFEKHVKRALLPSRETIAALAIRSMAYRRLRKLEEATKEAETAFELDSSNEAAKIAMAATYMDRRNYDRALRLLSGINNSATARILEATAYAKVGDFRQAIDIFRAIPEEKLSSKNVPLWKDRADFLQALKPFIASKMKNAVALKAQGRYKEALIEFGDVLKVADAKELEAVGSEIADIMERAPSAANLSEEARKHSLRGEMLTEQGKFEDAAKEYRKAIQTAPHIAKLYFNAALIHGKLKKYPQAIRYMQTYLLLAPEAPNARAAKDQVYKWQFMMEKEK